MPRKANRRILAEDLNVLRARLGRDPTPADLTPEMFRARTYLKYFSSWDEALSIAAQVRGAREQGFLHSGLTLVNLFTMDSVRLKTSDKKATNFAIFSSGIARIKESTVAVDPSGLKRLLQATPLEWTYVEGLEITSGGMLPRDFPEFRPCVYLLVSQKVALAAKTLGRTTDDLLYPKSYDRNGDGTITVTELRRLG